MGLLKMTERATSPFTYDKEYCTRDKDLEYIYMCREFSRWYNVIYEDGTKSTQFVHDNIPIEVEAIKETQRKNIDLGYVGWHVIVAIEWQDGTLDEMDLTEPKRVLQEAIDNARNNIAYALEQIKGLHEFYNRRQIEIWENEVEMQTTCLNRYVKILNKIQK